MFLACGFVSFCSNDKRAIRVDRVSGNTLEQMPPFLCALWLHAWLVDANIATLCGYAYVGLRALYAAMFWSKGYSAAILLVTTPAYLIIAYLLFVALFKYGL